MKDLPPNVTVLIDEAYHHFAMGAPQYRSFLDGKNPRVIVARTFSKVYALAGMRLGYAVSTAETVKQLRSYQTHDNVNIAGRQLRNRRIERRSGNARCRRPQCCRPRCVLAGGAVTRA